MYTKLSIFPVWSCPRATASSYFMCVGKRGFEKVYDVPGRKMIDISDQNYALNFTQMPPIFCSFDCFCVECIKSTLHLPMKIYYWKI